MSKPIDGSGLTFRQDYFHDPVAWRALVSLLDDTFGIDIGPLQDLGGPDPTSMPFGWFAADGALAANLSAFAMPLVINGRQINAAAFQSGAVRPPWRGRGLYRDLTRKALEWCESQEFEAIVLYTDKPSLYEPYGFRSLPMHRHSGEAPRPNFTAKPAQPLDPRNSGDLALLQEVLRTRAPVSDVLAVSHNAAMFLINTQLDPEVSLSWLDEEKAVIAWKQEEPGRFSLLDVVAKKIPPLGVILGGLGVAPAQVDVFFAPDKLDWHGEALFLESGTVFMLRGAEDLAPAAAAMLSPMADF
ncbi:GNAT family N-acetyltransferase [Rhizobium sp. P32RR-XVIII]|uniref:GNAT family N-acetyltransferase n=1 Tax=Rhizobium sp. P32RR-XVIII TaxID=2726738 RepID=UPI001456A523|nr:GNAT family N-acetyltransferase [Rhizobium sp. P32RR-XVIII]NLS02003.1 GNAT family N-acetyltransferase [Rhizobium sp. P32RR-XVIII]